MAKVQFDIAALEARIRAAAMGGVIDGAEQVRDEAIRSMTQDPKSGRKHSGLPNRSSAPGESPARQSGNLINQIALREDVSRLAVVINSGAAYAAALEFGTETMAPRPVMRPSLAKMVPEIEQAVRERVMAALK